MSAIQDAIIKLTALAQLARSSAETEQVDILADAATEELRKLTLSENEQTVIGHLASAWNCFVLLPGSTDWDKQEFMHAIHDAQRVILAMPTLRSGLPIDKEEL